MKTEHKMLNFSDISPICLVRMLLRNLWMMVAAALVFAMGTSLYYSWFHVPVYRATMTYAVTSRSTSYTSANNVNASREVAAVIAELLETNVITDDIRNYSPALSDFDGTILASQVQESNLINVTAEADSQEKAFRALDALVNLFPEISSYISSNSIVQVIRNPMVSSAPVNQVDVRHNAMKMGCLGGLLMAALLCWMSIRRETVQNTTGARHLLDAPIVATVCHEQKNRTLKAMLNHTNRSLQVFAPTTSFAYAEQINTICSQLEHENTSRGIKIIMITGVGENEGKSTIAGNVAAMLAMKGKSVALIDADLRKPAMNRFFDGAYKAALPLNRMLCKPFSRENLLDCMVKHERLGFYMLFPSGADSRSTELLTSQTMSALLRQLRGFDFVILDTPPMGFFADAEAVAEMVDASLLVARQDYTAACDINDAADTLRNSKSAFLGCILNDMRVSASVGYGYGHRYGYGSRYGYGYGNGGSTEGKTAQKDS